MYKIPVGGWTKHKLLKEAGRLNKKHFEDGMEGYTMYVLESDHAFDILRTPTLTLLLTQVSSDALWTPEAMDCGRGSGSLGEGEEGTQSGMAYVQHDSSCVGAEANRC